MQHVPAAEQGQRGAGVQGAGLGAGGKHGHRRGLDVGLQLRGGSSSTVCAWRLSLARATASADWQRGKSMG